MKILYYLSCFFWYALSLLPLRMLYVLSDALYIVVGRIVRYRHKVIRNNLRSSFPQKTEAELTSIERGFYSWFCDYLVETIKMKTMSRKEFMRRMEFTGTDKINEIVSSGQSVGVYLGHYGNWEWITSLPFWVTDKCICCQLYHPLENKLFDNLFKQVRERRGARCIPMQESLRRMAEYRREGKPIVVGYISDQVPLWWNIHHWVDFLNHDTPVLTGAERIVKHTRQAVFYGDMRHIKRGYYRCEFKLLTTEPHKTGEWNITDWYFQQLEQTITDAPAYWLWSHNRWKRTRKEFDRLYKVENGKVIPRQQ